MKTKKSFFLCAFLCAFSVVASAQSVLTATCYENDFSKSDDASNGGNVTEGFNGQTSLTFGPDGAVFDRGTSYSEERIYGVSFLEADYLDISLPSSKRLELKLRVQGFEGGEIFVNYDNFLRLFIKSTINGVHVADGIEFVVKPDFGDRPKEYELVYDLSNGWHNAGDDSGNDGTIPETFNDSEKISRFTIRPNNPEGVQFDQWGPGRITLHYLKLGDYVIQKTTVPLTVGTPVNVNLAEKIQAGATFVSITPYAGLPDGISVSSAGVVSGTPTSDAKTSINMLVTYTQGGEEKETVEKLYFAPASGNAIAGVNVYDPVVAERYYNLQGVEIKGAIPQVKGGVYIVKQTLQSGAKKTVKKIIN
jgi:hypothetical protein